MDENEVTSAPEHSDLPDSPARQRLKATPMADGQGDSLPADAQVKPETKGRFENFIAKFGIPTAILLGMLVIALSIFVSFGLPNLKTSQNGRDVAGQITPPPAAPDLVPPTADDDPVLGNADAPVTLIEFSDFQCPFCRKLWKETLPEIKKNYIDTGKAKLVYRDFPLSAIHPAAQAAAEAGECADDQGRFWEMHDKIYAEQDKKGQGTVQFEIADLKKWAAQIGLNISDFNNCLDSNKYKEEVEKDMADGQASGVTGTPGTFVNGKLIKGAVPYSTFSQEIEAALKK